MSRFALSNPIHMESLVPLTTLMPSLVPTAARSISAAHCSCSLILGVLLCTLGAVPSKSAETKAEWFTTPGHTGALVIDVPEGWRYKSRSVGGAPATVTIRNDDSVLNFTLMWNTGNATEFNSMEQLKAGLESTSAPYTADDADFEIENLSGSQVTGLYTALQNPDLVGVTELGPDQYRILTPGILAVGELQVFFTMISKEKDSVDRLLAIEMFRGARFEADASSRVDNRISVPVTVEDGPLSPSPQPDEHDSDGHSH